jgi:hypothetical protein
LFAIASKATLLLIGRKAGFLHFVSNKEHGLFFTGNPKRFQLPLALHFSEHAPAILGGIGCHYLLHF